MWCVQVVVERSKVTWPGARIAKKNEGMPNYENNNVRGTLFITFDVNFPKGELTAEDKAGERERDQREMFVDCIRKDIAAKLQTVK